MTRTIGIDLGTTNSVVAAISRGKPQVIPTRNDDRDWTPSLVLHEGGTFTVGHEVDAIASARKPRVAHSVKRLMGRRYHDHEVQRMLADGDSSSPWSSIPTTRARSGSSSTVSCSPPSRCPPRCCAV